MQEAIDPLAEELHAAAIKLLRYSRRGDPESGLSPARLSVLSVLVYGGACSLGDLARTEQVKPPTMTRLVDGLQAAGLVTRERGTKDRRKVRIAVTSSGRALLEAARQRRLAMLGERLATRTEADLVLLQRSAAILGRLFSPEETSDRR